MSDPLRTDLSRALDAAPEPGRDAKIEQLLLVGLDQYFAAQYEQAINVWTVSYTHLTLPTILRV